MKAQSNATEHKITLIPGDGIGPEITRVVVRILEATGLKFVWEEHLAGAEAYERYREYIPNELYQSIERNRVALKGPVTTPIGGRADHARAEVARYGRVHPICLRPPGL